MMISHVGRGGMSLHDVKGKPYATLTDQVILPEGTKTISEPKTTRMTLPLRPRRAGENRRTTTFTFTYDVCSIDLGTLRALVRRELEVVEKLVARERPAPGKTP